MNSAATAVFGRFLPRVCVVSIRVIITRARAADNFREFWFSIRRVEISPSVVRVCAILCEVGGINRTARICKLNFEFFLLVKITSLNNITLLCLYN